MGFRFRRTIRILPGVRLNINKGSLSVSVGPRGLKHTISTNETRTNTIGIPGSGLFYSERSKGSSKPPPKK
ncbi:DUF4236 domain-containing protein [Candidatus Cryosericum hinesii]|uniref:DUF4236 domain-containing protein n=1 Tax=Candidatus Cryosericum hinesii TaxID=2290915 RepID=A0ABX9MDD5_9BACT|nr:DUF4236 domain-containing protein [Candidatus Cryosericum hinesii]